MSCYTKLEAQFYKNGLLMRGCKIIHEQGQKLWKGQLFEKNLGGGVIKISKKKFHRFVIITRIAKINFKNIGKS